MAEPMLQEPQPPESTTENSIQLPAQSTAIIEHIVAADGVFFRHQQINDPDIGVAERRHIVTQAWHAGARQFLARFRQHLSAEQLRYIEQQCAGHTTSNADDAYEIGFYVGDSLERLQNRRSDVRNRRFEAMQRMLRAPDCSYFDEAEMMAREPLLYERLIGQYMTDGERVRRDKQGDGGADGADAPQFSRVLLDGIVRDQVEELRRQQEESERQQLGTSSGGCAGQTSDQMEEEEEEDDDDDIEQNAGGQRTEVHADGIIDDEYYPQVPPSFHQRWGDFEVVNQADALPQSPPANVSAIQTSESPATAFPATTTRGMHAQVSDQKQNYVTADEKDALCDEFYAAMYENFLQGRDRDFDYAAVDDNADFDDLEQLNRDKEDRYFDADDDEDDDNDGAGIAAGLALSSISEPRLNDSEDEDELDKYMHEINAS